jgi:hypothetical protein
MTSTAFATAAAAFADRLTAAGWPSALVWTRVRDVTRGQEGEVVIFLQPEEERDEDARAAFEAARAAGHGVALTAVCKLGDVTCATVEAVPGGADSFAIPPSPIGGSARWPVC